MSDTRKIPVLPIVIALGAAVALMLAVASGGSGAGDESPATVTSSENAGSSQLTELARRKADDPMALGDVDAPVVMIEYSEFQCPFCGKYSRETAPKLVEKYVDQGLLRIEFRDFPYLGDESDLAARAARAAAEQDSFWPFHERLFAEQPPPNSGRLDRERLSGIAKDLGLDTDRFLKDMDSDEVAAAIKRDRDEGMAIGVTGTPAFLINDRVLMGALPTEDFVETIDAAIKDARG
ncbi:hypothetical protein AFL01nite_13630 [Aeromicrobium flavum]|uniref:Thioredoxin domain-containing protein n=2 Tax=Aeromicrobium flavum TaxID=416568 RepID=A0A512HUA5_9ACTN|nr:hypothetical protein AFL01nite_13630 [Aeromicrobium flavum]